MYQKNCSYLCVQKYVLNYIGLVEKKTTDVLASLISLREAYIHKKLRRRKVCSQKIFYSFFLNIRFENVVSSVSNVIITNIIVVVIAIFSS